MTKDAEASKQQDMARKKIIELKNEADQFIYNTEQQLTEHSDKLPAELKDSIRKDISDLNQAIVAENECQIAEALERLRKSSTEIGKTLYE